MDAELKDARDTVFGVLSKPRFLAPWMFERTPASPDPVAKTYLRHVREADLVIWIVGSATTSPVQDEVREALANARRILAFLLPATRSPDAERLIEEVRPHAKYDQLASSEDLEESLTLALGDFLAEAVRNTPRPNRLVLIEGQLYRSRARHISRFLAAGLPRTDAERLADDTTVGRRATLSAHPDRPVTILVGDVGSGKSLLLDRWYSDALSALKGGFSSRLPVFLDAWEGESNLRDEVERVANGLGDPQRHGVSLFIDGLDEVPVTAASRIIEGARQLAFSWPRSSVVLATRLSPARGPSEEILSVPPLSVEEIGAIARAVNPHALNVLSSLFLSESIREAAERPLFALLLGILSTGDAADHVRTKADLIREFVGRALGHASRPAQVLQEGLGRLAAVVLDHGGRVPVSDLGATVDIQSLLETRLVILERDGTLRFSLRIFAEWFGAIALARGLVDPKTLATDSRRLERWHYAVVVLIGGFSDTDVSAVFSPISASDVGFASRCVREAVPRFEEKRGTDLSAEECGKRIRAATESWIKGLGPVAARLPMVSEGRLRPLGTAVSDGRLTTSWYLGARSREEVFPLPIGEGWSAYREESRSGSRTSRPPAYSAWAWRWSNDDIVESLSRLVKTRTLEAFTPVERRENFWRTARLAHGGGALLRSPIPLAPLHERLEALRNVGWINGEPVDLVELREEISVRRERGETTLHPPWSGPDRSPGVSRWLWSDYSPAALLSAAAGVYAGAAEIYEALVTAWFGSLRERLRHAAMLPAVVKGRLLVRTSENSDTYSPPILWLQWHPRPRPGATRFEFVLAEKGFSRDEEQAYWQEFLAVREPTHPWLSPRSGWVSLTKLYGMTPATDLAYEWLYEDLKETALVD